MNHPAHDLRWTRTDKFMLLFVILGVSLTILWWAMPSSLFIRTISITVQDNQVRFVRELPFGEVHGRWRAEITLIDGGGYECSSGGWREAFYQMEDGNTVVFDLGEWAADCIEAGPPFYLRRTQSVLLFGVIPLRPETITTEVQGERRDPARLPGLFTRKES